MNSVRGREDLDDRGSNLWKGQVSDLLRAVQQRVFWVLLRRIWTDWESVLVIVKPETVIRWHRCGFRRYWTWKSRRRRPGRPGVAPEIRELIRNMSRANPLWGAPRVHGELAKLGIFTANQVRCARMNK